ncbi:MAG: CopG family transcriptional regulator [Sphingobium sp.]
MLPERVHRQVQALAAANDVSAAWVIRQAVLQYLSERNGQVELPLGSGRP